MTDPRVNRRSFVQFVAASDAGGLAGCLDDTEPEPAPDDDTIQKTGDYEIAETDEQRRNERLVDAQKILEQMSVALLVGYRECYDYKNSIDAVNRFEHLWRPSSGKYYVNRFEMERQ